VYSSKPSGSCQALLKPRPDLAVPVETPQGAATSVSALTQKHPISPSTPPTTHTWHAAKQAHVAMTFAALDTT